MCINKSSLKGLLQEIVFFLLSVGIVSCHPQVVAFPSSCHLSKHDGSADVTTPGASLLQKASARDYILTKAQTEEHPRNSSWLRSDFGLSLAFSQTRHSTSTLALFFAIAALFFGLAKLLVSAWTSSEHNVDEEEEEEEHPTSEEEETYVSGQDITCSIGFHERDRYDERYVMDFIEKHYNSWKLLFNVMGALVRFWGLLAIMEFALLQDSNALMDCEEPTLGTTVRHMCKYTKACLYSYPVVCANMTLVLMVRVLVQMQLYYSMLKRKCVVDFVSVHIMRTPWPWICAFSMLQGGLHFALKTYMDTREVNLQFFQTCAAAAYKFIIPGIMFLSFFPHYTEVENMLVPLNRVVENDYTKHNRKCPWLCELEVVNERVLAKDVRGEDIFERTLRETGKTVLTIDDIMNNLIDNYEDVHKDWLSSRHSRGGRTSKWMFKAMWPAAVLFHRRMDWSNTETWQWMCVLSIMLTGSVIASLLSLFILISFCDSSASLLGFAFWRDLLQGWRILRTDTIIANIVLASHGIIVCFFLYRTIWGMFYQRLGQRSSDVAALGIICVVFFILGFLAKVSGL